MKLDSRYLKVLAQPLKGKAGLKPSQYFKALNELGVLVADENHIVDEKFLFHFRHSINTGIIENDNGTKNLNDYGVSLGADNYIALCDSAILMLSDKPKQYNSPLKWILDKIIAVVVAGLILAALISWLGYGKP